MLSRTAAPQRALLRVTESTVVGIVATEHSRVEILEFYPYLEKEDIRQALQYAAWRAGEVETLAAVVGRGRLADFLPRKPDRLSPEGSR